MLGRRSLAAAIAVALAGIAAAGHAGAQAPEAIALSWNAPEGCPDKAAIAARIEKLLGGPPAAGERQLAASAAVEAIPRGFRLTITLASGGSESARVLQGALCESVADAAALVIALAFDPEAVAAQEAKRAEAPSSDAGAASAGAAGAAPSSEASASPPGSASAPATAPVPAPAVIRIPVRFPARPATPTVERAPATKLSFGAFAELSGDAGSLPSVAPGVRAGLSLGIGAYRIEPAFEAWPSSRSALASQPAAGAELSLLAFALGACRRVLPWDEKDSAAAALGCLGFEIGEMRGAGFGVAQPGSGSALWAAPKAEIRAEVALARWAFLGLDVGLAVPLDPRRFVLDLHAGRAVVHQPSPVSGRAGLGLGLRF
jgi:hypothetical protein